MKKKEMDEWLKKFAAIMDDGEKSKAFKKYIEQRKKELKDEDHNS
jgi:hypothetical protein